MKAIQITAPSEMKVVDIEKPVLEPGEVLVKIKYVGFCGSDLNTFLGRNPMVKLPVIPGHEVGAVIEAVGKDVPDSLKPGMSVTVNPYTNCGKCASCRNGRVNACEHNETLGVQRNGAMCEYIALPWSKIIPAHRIPPRDCALIEPMSVGFHAVFLRIEGIAVNLHGGGHARIDIDFYLFFFHHVFSASAYFLSVLCSNSLMESR